MIYQERSGFIWIGTQEGLNRYDGKTFTVYRHNPQDANTLSHDVIRDIIEDEQGNLWVATFKGLNVRRSNSSVFQPVVLKSEGQELSSIRLNKLFIDSKQRLWIGAEQGGVYLLDLPESQGSGTQIDVRALKLTKELSVTEIKEDSRGRFWVGTDGDGILLLSANFDEEERFQFELGRTF